MALFTLNKQLLGEVFVIGRIISVKVKEITLTETLIIWHITKTESIDFKWRNP